MMLDLVSSVTSSVDGVSGVAKASDVAKSSSAITQTS